MECLLYLKQLLTSSPEEFPFREWLAAIGEFITGIGTVWLASIAYSAKSDFIKGQKFQNKMRLSRDAISIFNDFRNDIKVCRLGESVIGEEKQLDALDEKDDFQKKMKENSGVGRILLRLRDRQQSLIEMKKLEPEFRAVFGETSAFNELYQIRNKINVAAHDAIAKNQRAIENKVLWATEEDEDNDLIKKQVDEAVLKIEQICQPYLQGGE
jgi:hypothetical protein